MTREPYLMESKEGRELFDNWVDVWVAKVASSKHWDVSDRWHETISEANHADQNGAPKITPGMEAMTVMHLDNQEFRVACMVKERKGTGPTYQSHKKKTDSPWTIPNGGQMPWRGLE